ncbi:hypothetical protein JCM6882_001222 [Rhodosporidiobolus microsporus]
MRTPTPTTTTAPSLWLLLLATLLLLAVAPHLASAAPSSPSPPSADPQQRLALALGQNAEQYVVTGVGAPPIHQESEANSPSSGPALMDPLVKLGGAAAPKFKLERVGRRFSSLWERTEEEIGRAEKRTSGGGVQWREVERRGRKGARRLARYGAEETLE